ncbi:unnamed protein product [Adineta ricciae]|uniref:Enkurin domain-containing protein n=1 Tax=Adineta ricciae TaxID=249248 RepID=A0A814IPL9_ADIRI|nr:unnamed protein product [Adineta ricciae]
MVVGKNGTNQQDESVYNLIPRTQYHAPKPPRYESRFKSTVRDSSKDRTYEHRTMGYAEEPLPDPQQFLKKKQGESRAAAAAVSIPKDTIKCKDCQPRKPPIPSIHDAPKMGVRTEKNFVQTNALDTVMTVPKKPQRNIVDARHGDKYPIDPSGLTPKYVFKKDFGEVPVYIKNRRNDMEKAKQEYQTYVSDYFRRGAMREMGDDERQTIIDGLKKQWEDVHHEYQTLSVIIDTIPKRQHKERLEYEMKMLEKDIDLLEKHQVIYIAD